MSNFRDYDYEYEKNIGKAHEDVNPDPVFDKYHLNKGAVGYEGRHYIYKTTDPSFDNPHHLI